MPGFPVASYPAAVTVTDTMANISATVGNVPGYYVWLVDEATGIKYGPSTKTDSGGNWTLAVVQGIYATFYGSESPTGTAPTQWQAAGVKGYLVSIALNPPSLAAALGWVNPKVDSGAKCDGVTDDTVANQAAITAAGAGGKVIWPTGVSVISNKLNVTLNNQQFEGSSRYGSVIKRANTTNQRMFDCVAATGLTFYNLGFDQNGANQTSNHDGIRLDNNCNNATVERCTFINSGGFAIISFTGPILRPIFQCILANDIFQVAGSVNDLLTFGAVGGVCSYNKVSVQGGLGINVYEGNALVASHNQVSLNGLGGVGIRMSSTKDAVVSENTVVCGANDFAFQIMQETDNGGSLVQAAGLLMGNTASGPASATFCRLDGNARTGCTDTAIRNNISDGLGFFVVYNSLPIVNPTVEGNTLINCGNPFTFVVTPTGTMRHRNNPGYNPVGNVTGALKPGMPGSGSGVNNLSGLDLNTVISCGAGVTLSALAINGTTIPGFTIAAATSSPLFMWPAGAQLVPTYAGGTPTFTVFGQ